jgi:hypothetical protein
MTVDDATYQRAQTNGTVLTEEPDVMRKDLAEMLELAEINRGILDVQMFGRGPNASVDLQLSGDVRLTFERFADVTKPPALTAHLASIGIARTFKGREAALAGALISRLARHHDGESAEAIAAEWGREFVRLAALQEADLDDQAERWRAFASLRGLNPARDAGEDRSSHSLACAAVVLADKTSGVRLVRCGWFLSYVRREVGGMYSPQSLGTQMERAGWQRSGREGRIKATCPDDPRRTLIWRFYSVPNGWDDQ